MATVFIVDDDVDFCRTAALLVRSAGLDAEAHRSLQEFLNGYDSAKRGCLILDIALGGMSTLELQKQLKSRDVSLPIIFITAHGEVPMATQAMRAGAVDFIQKPVSHELLLDRINEAIAIESDAHHRRDLASAVEQRVGRLTGRERQILYLLASGESAKQIAHRLSIRPKTVDNHRAKILEKMEVDNPAQLAHLLATHQSDPLEPFDQTFDVRPLRATVLSRPQRPQNDNAD
jgi:two-component system response regulator FixJ